MIPGLPPLVHLETIVADGSASAVTLPASGTIAGHANFPSGSRHVVVMWNARSTKSGTAEDYATVRVNGDTGTNYDMQRLDGNGTDDLGFRETGINCWSQIAVMAADDSASGLYTPGYLMIPHAFGTDNFTTMVNMVGNAETRVRFGVGNWRNAAAVTSVTFTVGDELAGSLSLYVVDEDYLVTSGEQIIAGSAAAFSDVDIPDQAGDISIISYLRSSASSTNEALMIDLNADATESNYKRQYLYGLGSGHAAGVSTSNRQIGGTGGDNADEYHFSPALTTVQQPNPGDNDPHVLSINGHHSVSAADYICLVASAQRDNVEKVTSVNLTANSSPNTWEIGSGMWVYAVPKSLISRTTLTGTATNVSFDLTSLTIPANTQSLRVNCYARSDRSAPSSSYELNLNGDTTAANYEIQKLIGRGSTVQASSTSAWSGGGTRVGRLPAASATANEFGSNSLLFPNYARAGYQRTFLAFCGAETHSDLGVRLFSGRWENTAALTTITITCGDSANFIAGSIFELDAIIGPVLGWTGTVNTVANPQALNTIDKGNIERVNTIASA